MIYYTTITSQYEERASQWTHNGNDWPISSALVATVLIKMKTLRKFEYVHVHRSGRSKEIRDVRRKKMSDNFQSEREFHRNSFGHRSLNLVGL